MFIMAKLAGKSSSTEGNIIGLANCHFGQLACQLNGVSPIDFRPNDGSLRKVRIQLK